MRFFDFFTREQPPLVEEALNQVKTMLSNGKHMFAAASAQLLDNEILDVDLHVLDGEINRCEQKLRRAVLEHLNVDPNQELVFSLKLISIVHEAERIGDLAKTLSHTAELAHKPRLGRPVEPLREARNSILNMFEDATASIADGNEAAARHLMHQHKRTKGKLTETLHEVANDSTLTPNEAVVYAMAARMMSRVSSHLANIASTVACPFDQIRSSPTWAEEGISESG